MNYRSIRAISRFQLFTDLHQKSIKKVTFHPIEPNILNDGDYKFKLYERITQLTKDFYSGTDFKEYIIQFKVPTGAASL